MPDYSVPEHKVKVLAGAPCSKTPVCDLFYDCFNALELPTGSMWQRIIGGSIPVSLNKLVDLAIERECTHLFIVEDDSLFEPDVVNRLLKHDVPVVAGLCRARGSPFRAYVYRGLNEDGLAWYKLQPSDKGLIKCSATGMGGILINTEVFKKLKRPYFYNYILPDGREWGQDIVFGKSLVEAGVDVYCDLDVVIGHQTNCIIGSTWIEDEWRVSLRVNETVVNIPQMEG